MCIRDRYRFVLPALDVDATLYASSKSSMLCGGLIVLMTRLIFSFWEIGWLEKEFVSTGSFFVMKYADAPPIATTKIMIPIILVFNMSWDGFVF